VGVETRLYGDRRKARRDVLTAGRRRRLLLALPATLVLAAGVSIAMPFYADAVAAPALPDGRAYELVSTSGLFGEPYQPASPVGTQFTGLQETERQFQAAETGDAVTYIGEPPAHTGGSGETGPGEGNQWLATRTASGWDTAAITPPATSHRTGSELLVYQAFSPDLSSATIEGGLQPLTSEVAEGCRALYSRSAATGAFEAVFTTAEAPGGPGPCGKPLFAGVTQDRAHTIFQSQAALTANAEAATEPPPGRVAHNERGAELGEACMFGCNLYETVGEQLRLVSVVEGTPVANANFGGYPGEEGLTNYSNAISTDGSRIFWTDTAEGPLQEHVYVLEDGTTTVQVSGAGHAEYWTATPDGHFSFYTENGGLWRFDTQTNTREPLAAESAGVQGVIGTNQTGEDGAYLYFVAHGVLAGNKREYESQTSGPVVEEATAGEDNLYVMHEGSTSFIGILSPLDNSIPTIAVASRHGGDWKADLGERTAQVTPDGRHLVFESLNPLTGYDNQTPLNEATEVFVYAADSAQLACASCDPSGASARVREPEEHETRLPVSEGSVTYTRRWISSDGDLVFFDSAQSLVAQDTNGVQDVYEWEREGTSGCPSATSEYGGCIFLISGANNRGYSFLVDTDGNGDNVFFEHQGPLGAAEAPADYNELYDARVDGGFTAQSTACEPTGCPGAGAEAPSFPTPASISFSGIGNFTPEPAAPPKKPTKAQLLSKALKKCKAKKRRQKRVACERQARKTYAPAHRTAKKKGRK
jgi:hypothetical protein